jgi:1,4-alpha-glucan branching enzyme
MSFSFLWSIDVVFKVNMNYQIQLGNFDPTTDFVDVAGNFNGWDGSGAMDDTDADGIYEQTLTGFNVGDNLEFKFRINSAIKGRVNIFFCSIYFSPVIMGF